MRLVGCAEQLPQIHPGTRQDQQNGQEHRNDSRDMHVLQGRDNITRPLGECDAHDAEDELGHSQHDDHKCTKAESRTEEQEVAAKDNAEQVANSCGKAACATARPHDRYSYQRQQRQRVLREHRAASNRQTVGLVFQLAGSSNRSDQRMPPGYGTAGNGDEEHRPEWLPGFGCIISKAPGLERLQRKRANLWFDERRQYRPKGTETDGQQGDPETDVVDGLRKAPNG